MGGAARSRPATRMSKNDKDRDELAGRSDDNDERDGEVGMRERLGDRCAVEHRSPPHVAFAD